MTSVAEVIADTLVAAGVQTVFGLPGGETVELLDALRERSIDFLLVRNESSAVFMADAYARISGTFGVCLTTLGPGAANAVVGVAHCHLDRSPVIVITAQKPDNMMSDYTHQVLDLHALFRPITKASFKIDAASARQAVQDAVVIACSGRPGPVHLQLSNEDAASTVTHSKTETMLSNAGSRLVFEPESPTMQRARQCLARAERPLIIAGLGLEPQRPYAELRALAESLNAPVVVTPKAKGALSDGHPLAAGAIGLTRTDPVYELVEEADCVIAVGFDVVELVKPWAFDGALLWIAPWENHDPRVPAESELVGDMSAILLHLAQGAPRASAQWGESRVARFRQRTQPTKPAVPTAGRLSPQTALDVMRRGSDSDVVLAVDVGSHKIFSSLNWPTNAPNRFLLSNGLSSMGFALPAAIGGAIANPGTPAICLTGDAGLFMNMGELGVLAERRLPVVVVVFNDGAIDLIRSHQQRAGKPVFGTEFQPARFDQLGAVFGLASSRVQDAVEFEATLSKRLAAAEPALIEVMLDPSSYPTTPRNAANLGRRE